MRFLSQYSLCTVSTVVTVPLESAVVKSRCHTFQLQLCSTVTDKAVAAALAQCSSPCVMKSHQERREEPCFFWFFFVLRTNVVVECVWEEGCFFSGLGCFWGGEEGEEILLWDGLWIDADLIDDSKQY